MATEQVLAVVDAHPDQYRAMPVVAAGAGLRQGEVFGLRVEDVDFLGRKLHVRQQVRIVSGDADRAAEGRQERGRCPWPTG